MDSSNHGDPRSRVPRPAQLLARFPGPVAIAAGPVEGAAAVLGAEEIDGRPWAIEVGYTTAGCHLLTVRTVRSAAGLDPRGLTVESLASAVVNFVARDEAARTPAVDRRHRPQSQGNQDTHPAPALFADKLPTTDQPVALHRQMLS